MQGFRCRELYYRTLYKAGEFERYVIAGDINGVFKVLKDKEQIEITEIIKISSGNVFIEE